jgi:hypothetical protein
MNVKLIKSSALDFCILTFALFTLPSKAQLLSSYWPLNVGDQRTFLYGDSQQLTMTVVASDSFDSQAGILESNNQSSSVLNLDDDGTNCFISVSGERGAIYTRGLALR